MSVNGLTYGNDNRAKPLETVPPTQNYQSVMALPMLKSAWLKRKMSAAPVLILEDISVGLMAKNDTQAGLLTRLHFLSALPSHALLSDRGQWHTLTGSAGNAGLAPAATLRACSSEDTQQRVCQGFSPCSLFNRGCPLKKMEFRSPVVGRKGNKNFLISNVWPYHMALNAYGFGGLSYLCVKHIGKFN